MAYDYLVLIIQSRQTGRFLLIEENGEWSWPSILKYDCEKAMLAESLEKAAKVSGKPNFSEDILMNFVVVPERSKLMVFHGWVDEETAGTGSVEWCSLFCFPDKCHPLVNKVLNFKHLQELAMHPEI